MTTAYILLCVYVFLCELCGLYFRFIVSIAHIDCVRVNVFVNGGEFGLLHVNLVYIVR